MTGIKADITKNIRESILTLLSQNETNPQLNNDDSLVVSRRLDSLQIVELASQLEAQYGIDFATRGFDQYDFDSVESIVAMVLDQQ